jgi:hypothetical protein
MPGESPMNKTGVLSAIIFCALLFSLPAECSHPVEPLADVVGASPFIFLGKISATRKTDKFITRDFVNYYFWVFTIKIDKVVKGDSTLKTFDFMDFAGGPGCVDTTRNVTFLFFLSKSVVVAPNVTDWMVEREYKIVKGTITPTEFLDETNPQPIKIFIKKIGKIVREQQPKK